MSVPQLTPVEEQIVLMVTDGQSHEAIAGELGVSVRTVEWHVNRARRKLERAAGLHDRIRATEQPPKQSADAGRRPDLASGLIEKGDQS